RGARSIRPRPSAPGATPGLPGPTSRRTRARACYPRCSRRATTTGRARRPIDRDASCLDCARRASKSRGPSHLEDVIPEARQVQVEATCQKVVAAPVVDGGAHTVPEPHRRAPQLVERKAHVALALVGDVVHGHEDALAVSPTPAEADEPVPRS